MRFFTFLILICISRLGHGYHENPYEVLGVKSTSSFPEIRDAYKRLVKIWHPDKNDHKNKQEFEEKFRKINGAYQDLLKVYKQPIVTKNPLFKHVNVYSYDSAIDYLNQMSISFMQYQYIYVPKSRHVPILFFVYADWCLLCFENVPIWQQLRSTLEPLRVQFKSVHYLKEPTLARKLNYHSVPSLVVLIDGKPFVYKDAFNHMKILAFIKQRLPFSLINDVQNGLDNFLSTTKSDNRVRALLIVNSLPISLSYHIIAYSYRSEINFGYILNETISTDFDTLSLFNEHFEHSIVTLKILKSEQNFDFVFNSLDKYRFLLMPRLSSTQFFDNLCPVSSNEWRHVCLVLLVRGNNENNNHYNDRAVDEFRNFSLDFQKVITPRKTQLRFTYVNIEHQLEFLSNFLTPPNRTDFQPYEIVAMTRFDDHKNVINFVWFPNRWLIDTDQFNDVKFELYEFIDELLTFKRNFTFRTVQDNRLKDERSITITNKVRNYLISLWVSFNSELTTEHILTVISVVVSILFVLVITYLMYYFGQIEEEKVNRKLNKMPKMSQNKTAMSTSQIAQNKSHELRLHELRIEKYNGLVRLLKPGCRTIILIVDLQSRLQLIPKFHKIVWPYRKNKCLMFAHMAIERGLGWYQDLLQLAIPEKGELHINPRNCVGTVLSLNGYRKYFCMYHAKHPETIHSEKKFLRLRNTRVQDIEKGTNLGFGSSFDSESESDDNGNNCNLDEFSPKSTDVLLENELLKGLPIWLDKLFEDTTQRYFVNYWPEFTR